MNAFSNLIPDVTIADGHGSTWAGLVFIGVLSLALGFSLNRGSICTYKATDELVRKGRPARLIALLESALWAGIVYALLPSAPHVPMAWLPPLYMVLGALSLAVGIYLNGACVFGSIGHIGNGHLDFAMVFVGIFIVAYLQPLTDALPNTAPLDLATPKSALLLTALILLLVLARRKFTGRAEGEFWTLGLTMGAVGLAFALLLTLTPLFSITASINHVVMVPVAGGVTAAGMVIGSLISGHLRVGPFKFKRPTLKGMLLHLSGGVMIGLGVSLVPNGNDTLLLVGIPGGAWQAMMSYVLIVAMLAALIKGIGKSNP